MESKIAKFIEADSRMVFDRADGRGKGDDQSVQNFSYARKISSEDLLQNRVLRANNTALYT